MQTTHLTEAQVSAYLRDLGERIRKLDTAAPQVWATVGASGSIIGKRFAELEPDLFAKADELLIAYDRATDLVTFPREENAGGVVRGKRILLIDGTVHSGGTLLRIVKEIEKLSPSAITSYALVVRRGAKIIPNHFGYLIGDHDRVHFPSTVVANNCLCEYGVYRKISEEDASRKMIETGRDFIDKITWEDRLYEVATDPGKHVYLYEQNGEVCGFVSFRLPRNRTLLIDEVAVDLRYRGQRLGGHLMRWAEHFGRHRNCTAVELWAVADRVGWYKDLGYEPSGKPPLKIGGHEFWFMRKKLLYNLADDDTLTMGS